MVRLRMLFVHAVLQTTPRFADILKVGGQALLLS